MGLKIDMKPYPKVVELFLRFAYRKKFKKDSRGLNLVQIDEQKFEFQTDEFSVKVHMDSEFFEFYNLEANQRDSFEKFCDYIATTIYLGKNLVLSNKLVNKPKTLSSDIQENRKQKLKEVISELIEAYPPVPKRDDYEVKSRGKEIYRVEIPYGKNYLTILLFGTGTIETQGKVKTHGDEFWNLYLNKNS